MNAANFLTLLTGKRKLSFNPASVAGYFAHFDAYSNVYQEITGAAASTPSVNNGDLVGTWRSKTGGLNAVSPASGNRANIAIVSGRTWIRFNGTTSYFSTGVLADQAQPITYFIVFKRTGNVQPLYPMLDSPTVGKRNEISLLSPGYLLRLQAGATTDQGAINTSPHVASVIINGATSNSWVDGVQIHNNLNAGAQVSSGIVIGSNIPPGGSNYFDGDIGEVIRYNGALDTTDRQNIENYLRSKWGI